MGFELTTVVEIGTDYTGSCKSKQSYDHNQDCPLDGIGSSSVYEQVTGDLYRGGQILLKNLMPPHFCICSKPGW